MGRLTTFPRMRFVRGPGDLCFRMRGKEHISYVSRMRTTSSFSSVERRKKRSGRRGGRSFPLLKGNMLVKVMSDKVSCRGPSFEGTSKAAEVLTL